MTWSPRVGFSDVLQDPCSQRLLAHATRVGPLDTPVLITGEPSTGKQSLARHIHSQSRRASGPFRAVNCATVHPDELEALLLGHERGAVRGAFTAGTGCFEAADRGTLFLDEIQALPADLQRKLVAIVQTGQVTRLGGHSPWSVDVRLIAASSGDPVHLVQAGQLQPDVLAALGETRLQTRPLRDRPGDILPLAEHFVARWCARLDFAAAELSTEAQALLLAYPWPGNIRELENAVQHALLRSDGGVALQAADFRAVALSWRAQAPREPFEQVAHGARVEHVAHADQQGLLGQLEQVLTQLLTQAPGQVADLVERELYSAAYKLSGHHQLKAAELLGVTRNVLRGRLIQHGEIDARK